MELKKEHIGSKVYVRGMKRFFTVNEANKEIFFQFGHFNLFEDEHIDNKGPAKSNGTHTKRAGKPRNARIVPVQVHPRRDEPTDTDADSGNIE